MNEKEFEKVLNRVFNFKSSEPSWDTWPDQKEPGRVRALYKYIGESGGEEGGAPAPIEAEHFTVGVVKMGPGNRPPRHTHSTEEVFIPLDGKWVVELGDEGEKEIPIEKWDCVSVPAGTIRTFINVGNEESYMMAIMGSSNPLITDTETEE